MENVMISLNDAVTLFFGACSGIAVIGVAITWILKLVGVIRKPEKDQDAKIAELKRRVDGIDRKFESYDSFFAADKHRLDDMETGNVVIIQAILVLTRHAINGNDTDKLKESQSNLEKYLTERRQSTP